MAVNDAQSKAKGENGQSETRVDEQKRTWGTEEARETRVMIGHESHMIDQRLRWFLMLQGFLFAGVGFASDADRGMKWLIPVFAIVAIVSSLSVLYVVYLADKAIRDRVGEWEGRSKSSYDGPPVIGHGLMPWFCTVWCPWFLMPIVLVAVWTAVWLLSRSP